MRLSAVLSTVVLSTLPAFGADLPPVSMDAVQAHATFLADDTLLGRNTGSEGYAIAANYAAAQFRQYGLEPAGDGGSYLQQVPLVETRLTGSVIDILAGGKTIELNALEDYIVRGSTVEKSTSITAPVVFVGYGIEAPGRKHRDYAKADVKGKIVMMFNGAPASFPPDERAHYSSSRLKSEEAEKRGAVGIIRVRTKIDTAKYPWERYLGFADTPSYNWIRPDGDVQDAFGGLKFIATLSSDGARKLASAAGASYDEWMDGAEAATYETGALPVEVAARVDSMHAKVTSPNVVALLRGSDPKLAGEFVVVSAHLDHVGVGAEENGDRIYNGYYDNAMGSAIVIELARILSQAETKPKRSVLFLLVTAEEKGLLGSDYFAQHPTVPKEKIVANVNTDMPLLLHDVSDVIAFGAEHTSLGGVVEHLAKENGFTLSPDPDPSEVIFVRSDQYSFVRQGVPSIYVDPGFGTAGGGDSGKNAVLGFLRAHYHKPSDDATHPVHRDAATRYVRLNAELVHAIADADEKPRWNKGNFFGLLFDGHGAK